MCLYNLIQNLTLLKNLDLGNNQLSDVPALPPSLEVLKMNTNELGALGPHCFTGKPTSVGVVDEKLTEAVVCSCRTGEPAEPGAAWEHSP